MRTIAVMSRKGGVGKTTTTANLGHALVLAGFSVLLIDMDPQGQLAACLGQHRPPTNGLDRVLLDKEPISAHAFELGTGLSLLAAGDELQRVEHLQGSSSRGYLLQQAVRNLWSPVDFVLLDCPPASGLLAMNAVIAADDVLVPTGGDYLSLTALARLMVNLRQLQGLRDAPLTEWIFFSRFMPRRRLSREVYAKVVEHFSHQLLRTTVHEAAVLAECAGAGKTIFEYRGTSGSAKAFAALADDLLNRRVVANEKEATRHVA